MCKTVFWYHQKKLYEAQWHILQLSPLSSSWQFLFLSTSSTQHIFFLVCDEKQMQTNSASEQQDGIVCWSCTLLIWVQRIAKNKQRIQKHFDYALVEKERRCMWYFINKNVFEKNMQNSRSKGHGSFDFDWDLCGFCLVLCCGPHLLFVTFEIGQIEGEFISLANFFVIKSNPTFLPIWLWWFSMWTNWWTNSSVGPILPPKNGRS